ncbi:deoxynucleoside kinase [Tunicatimonas pelagia]|uniref:deoxynucleoside kinase n=1 Tax=Tunicatimonas pelagia TaxID=931531 RepID=UPI002665DD57|nr:deoxynucleoside kinase [Tunicatimonas pelagia]WKN43930.1 deoxynucleoside kinase [Tunicatimonas pelagia]
MIIAVSGNIGAGKTTLVKRLATHFEARAELEAVQDNPYLNDFYEDMARWAFPLQIYFLSHRFEQGVRLASCTEHIILDRTIYEDAHIFAANLFKSGYLSDRDYQNYCHLYETMIGLVPPPDLIIFLKGSIPTLQQRIQQRHSTQDHQRKNEDTIPTEYLQNLNNHYEQWMNNFSRCPIFTIDIDLVDLAEEPSFQELLDEIAPYLPVL